MLIHITNTNYKPFCCGIVYNYPKRNKCAPIVKYMQYWTVNKIKMYCKKRGWEFHVTD